MPPRGGCVVMDPVVRRLARQCAVGLAEAAGVVAAVWLLLHALAVLPGLHAP
jgi:hypothetical protein